MSQSVILEARLFHAEVLAAPSPLVLDARTEGAYVEGHAPGALRVPVAEWERWLKAAESGPERRDFWLARLGELGIDGKRPVLIYDDGKFSSAARVWFVLQLARIAARIVAGGWPAISRELAAIPEARVETGPRAPEGVLCIGGAMPIRARVVDGAYVNAQLGTAIQLADVRAPDEYGGTDARQSARGGHIPGAVNLPHRKLLNADGQLLSADALVERFARAGFKPGAPLVTYCGGGGRAIVAALAAIEAGFSAVEVYYRSYGDWCANPENPVER